MKSTIPEDSITEELLSALPCLLKYAIRLTGDKQHADDLLQDTALKILSNPACYVYNANFNGWASTIMHSIFINEVKRGSRSIATDNISLFERVSCDGDVVSHELFNAIDKLDAECHVVLSMYADGYMYREISARLNLPLGTVKSRIHTARSCLRDRFMV